MYTNYFSNEINRVIDKTNEIFNYRDILLAVIIAIVIICGIKITRYAIISVKIRKLADNTMSVTPEQFFKIRNSSNGGRGNKHISTSKDFSGVYILYNHTKKKYYVGQAKKVFQRVNNHFTGHGNGDVYADYKCLNDSVNATK